MKKMNEKEKKKEKGKEKRKKSMAFEWKLLLKDGKTR